jgi:hypothetical protein
MGKILNNFVISNISWAIWELECSNKLQKDAVPEHIINELKEIIILLKVNPDGMKESE